MSRLVRLLLPLIVAGLLAPHGASGQSGGGRTPFAVTLNGGVGSVPGTFTVNACSSWIGAGMGMGASAAPRPWLSIEVGAQSVLKAGDLTGCDPEIETIPIGPNEYEIVYAPTHGDGRPRVPFVQTDARVRLRAPQPFSLVRGMVGAGVVWGRGARAFPLVTYGIGLASRGMGRRLFVDVERSMARMRVDEVHERFTLMPSQTPLGTRTVRVVKRPAWVALRLGVELPL